MEEKEELNVKIESVIDHVKILEIILMNKILQLDPPKYKVGDVVKTSRNDYTWEIIDGCYYHKELPEHIKPITQGGNDIKEILLFYNARYDTYEYTVRLVDVNHIELIPESLIEEKVKK